MVHEGCVEEHLSWTVHSVYFCLQEASAVSKFLLLLEVGQAVQIREVVKLIAFVVAGGLGGKEMKTSLGKVAERLQPSSRSTNKQVDSIRGSWELLA